MGWDLFHTGLKTSWREFVDDARLSAQPPKAIAAAREKLQTQGLGEFSDFDRRRAATIPELNLDFKAKAAHTPFTDSATLGFLNRMPKFMFQMLAEFDSTVYTGNTPKDIDAKAPYEFGRGLEGKTREEGSSGSFYRNSNVIAVVGHGCDKNRDCTHKSGTVAHEIGHAVDKYLGYPSEQPAFTAAYQKDIEALRNVEIRFGQELAREHGVDPSKIHTYSDNDLYRKGFGDSSVYPATLRGYLRGDLELSPGYFFEKKHGGTQDSQEAARSEAFAEIFGYVLAKRTDPKYSDPSAESLIQKMPATTQHVTELFNKLERYYQIAPLPVGMKPH